MSELIVKPLDDGVTWELIEPYSFYSLVFSRWFTIEKGFKTDFASIPLLMQWFEQPATGKHRKSAVEHDFLYQVKYEDRALCDKHFLDSMLRYNVNRFKAYAMYIAVRLFGGSHWN